MRDVSVKCHLQTERLLCGTTVTGRSYPEADIFIYNVSHNYTLLFEAILIKHDHKMLIAHIKWE